MKQPDEISESCKIYDPQNNRPDFTPKQRKEWTPLYPVYKAKQKFRHGATWYFLFECKHCGDEIIHSLAESAPRTCACRKLDRSRSAPINIKCTNCGGWYWTTKQKKGNTTRHYCSDQCKKEYAVKCRPTAEWLTLSNKDRGSRLKNLTKPGTYDYIYHVGGCDNVMEVCR